MKLFSFVISLFILSTGFTQSLPIDFESGVITSDFTDFDGGVATVVANPFVTGTNTSNTVGRIIRNGGTIWAGSKIALSNNLDFSVLTKISMQVYTTAPIGTTVKFKLEGTGPSVDVDATTTTTGTWETLEWIFAGTSNNLNEVVLMFDFGNVGDGSASSTFYFDDIQQIAGPPAPNPVTLPVDFESNVVSTDFLNYSGANATVINNPQIGGINTSNTVCEIVRNGGDIWAGSTLSTAGVIDLSSMWHISMKVFTNAPIGTRVKLQLEGTSPSVSLDVFTTVTGAWETLNWNFHGQPNNFDKISFMFDFGNVGDGTSASTFLFDDIQQIVGPAIPAPNPTPLPIDFESNIVTTDFINQFGATGSVIPNPQMNGINTSATVGHYIKSGGQGYARTLITLTNTIDFVPLSSISMKVYTDAPVGTVLKLKVESTTSGAANEKDTYVTVSGAWAEYSWDFTGDPPIYDVITLMFGYGVVGDASSNSTFLIDDIEQVVNPNPPLTTNLPIDFEGIVSTHYFSDFDGAGSTVIANPQVNSSNLSDSVAKMIRNGGQIWAGSKILLGSNIDFTTDKFISMKVYTEAPIGTPVKLKLEGPGAAVEVDQLTTVTGQWETLNFDFTGQPNIFNSLVFMFDFGNVGDGGASSTFLFDDIEQTNGSTIGLSEKVSNREITIFPNPTKDFISIHSKILPDAIIILDVLGNTILESEINTKKIDVRHLNSGVYFIEVHLKNNMILKRIVIE